MNPFTDRRAAGRALAERLGAYAHRADVTVLALPRGGVPVAYEVACALQAPLDVILVEKVYAPGRDDVQIGTLASGGFELRAAAAANATGVVDPLVVEREVARARQGMAYRERLYRELRPLPVLDGRTVVLVYDGIATGALMLAAVAAVRARGAARVIVASPVAAPNACVEIERSADACVSVLCPDPLYRIGIWYDDYAPVTDASVTFLLERAPVIAAPAAA
jgi:putative phosphoribosyl transferase